MRDEPLQVERRKLATVSCPGCSHPLRLARELSGRRIRCLSCRSVLAVQASEDLRSLTCTVVDDGGSRFQLCPECGGRLRVVQRLHGRRVRCKSCQTVLRVSVRPWKLSAILPQRTVSPPPTSCEETAVPRDARPAGEGLPSKSVPADAEAVRSSDGLADGETARRANGTTLLDALAQGEASAPTRHVESEGDSGSNASQPVAQPEKKPARSLRPRPQPASTVSEAAKWRPTGKRLTWTGAAFTVAALSVVVFGLAVVGGLAVGAWWLLFPDSVHPQARYLPEDCDWFTSLDWQQCAASGWPGVPNGTLVAMLLLRCRVFLTNAGLPNDAVERINAGRAADGAGMVVVYRLTRAIKPDEVLQKRAFRGKDKSRYVPETIGGVPVFVYQTVALAFPEPKVILSGDLFIIRKVLTRWSSGVRDPMKSLLGSLDFSIAAVSAAVGAPKPLLTTHLQDCKPLESSISGTCDSCEFGETVRFVRIIHVAESQAAEQIQRSLKRSLAETAKKLKASETTRKTLASIEISGSEDGVKMAVSLRKEELNGPLLPTLTGLFQ